jgi:putative lipoprotein
VTPRERLVATAALAAVLLTGAPHVPPAPDRWFGADKLKHFFMSAFIQSVSYSALRAADAPHGTALAGASAATAAFGVGKELHDWRARGEFSLRDLTWDAAGGAAASVLLNHTQR